MSDAEILALYWERNENAIRQTDAVYGRRLHVLSGRIVNSHEDAQECVNDTYMKASKPLPNTVEPVRQSDIVLSSMPKEKGCLSMCPGFPTSTTASMIQAP